MSTIDTKNVCKVSGNGIQMFLRFEGPHASKKAGTRISGGIVSSGAET